LLPAAAFIAFMAYHWRFYDLATIIPAYGDVLESLWGIDWLLDVLRGGGGSLQFIPYIFMPEGWSPITFAHGPGVFLAAALPAALTNAAVAFNLLQLASFLIAYAGAYRLGRLIVGPATAVLMAWLYLLWGGRWVRLAGQLNILLGSAMLPWLILCLERVITERRWGKWAVVAGAIWAGCISLSLYFIWLGFFVVAGWLLGAAVGRRISLTGALLRLGAVGAVALLLCAPYLWLYWRHQTSAVAYDIRHVDSWSVSLDRLTAFLPDHPLPLLRQLAARQTGGARTEGTFSGFGIILPVLALFGLTTRRRPAQWAGILIIAGTGIVLSLGMTVKWNGTFIPAPVLRPLNEALWDAGHALKPAVFPGPDAPPEFADAIPAPGLIPAILAPFYEGARVTARFLLVAAPGVLLLAALGFARLPRRWLKLLVVALLLIEAARRPITGVPFPPPPHPIFAATAELTLAPGESVLDLGSPIPQFLIPAIGGETLWASSLHKQPIASGGGSVLPIHTAYLRDWFLTHPNMDETAELSWLLRGYGVRYVLLHMSPKSGEAATQLAAGTADFLPRGCIDGPQALPWNYPICLLEVTPPPATFNVFPAENWGGDEEWGQWATGRESIIRWVATNRDEARFAVEAFPQCIPGPAQELEIVVAGQVLAAHRWDNCDPWRGEIVVPSELIDIGWNEIVLRFARADRPTDVTGGANPDTRELSVGFTRFERLP